jgi:hypothetical protein
MNELNALKKPGESTWVVCACKHCSGRLEFDRSHVGTVVPCPHCGKDTVLAISQTPTTIYAQERLVDPRDAGHRDESDRKCQATGIASQLDLAGNILFILGIGVAVVAFLYAVSQVVSHAYTDEVLTPQARTDFIIGAVAVGQGVLIRLLFHAGAEVIRLLTSVNEKLGRETTLVSSPSPKP